MFGQFNHTIDAKGRVIIPAKFRDVMGDSYVITRGIDHNLMMYAQSEWNNFEAKVRALPMTSHNARKLRNFFLMGAADVTVDRQGRITIPLNLRTYASLDKEVILAGDGNHIDLWDPKICEEMNTYDDMDEVAESCGNFGITF